MLSKLLLFVSLLGLVCGRTIKDTTIDSDAVLKKIADFKVLTWRIGFKMEGNLTKLNEFSKVLLKETQEEADSVVRSATAGWKDEVEALIEQAEQKGEDMSICRELNNFLQENIQKTYDSNNDTTISTLEAIKENILSKEDLIKGSTSTLEYLTKLVGNCTEDCLTSLYDQLESDSNRVPYLLEENLELWNEQILSLLQNTVFVEFDWVNSMLGDLYVFHDGVVDCATDKTNLK